MIRRLLLGVLACLAVALLLPAAAGAHASLTATSPESGSVLDAAPKRVVFTFSERVEGSFGALRVVDDRGRRVDDGEVGRPSGRDDQLSVGVRPGTGRGAYAATYRVVSADGHPVTGGATFVVGRGVTAAPPDVRELTAQEGAPAGVGTALSVARVIRYLGIGGVTGLLVLVLVVWAPLRARGTAPADADEAFTRAAGRALRGVAVVGLVGSLAALVLQAAVAGGTGVGEALKPSVLGDVVGTRTGGWFLVSAVAFAVLIAIAGRALRSAAGDASPSRRPTGVALVAVVLAALLVVAPALGGHAAASSPAWALVPIQIVHVAGMGTWLGGLAGLLLVLPRATRTRPAGRERHALLAAVLLRFSPVALGSVAVLTLAGTGLALLHLTSLYDLTDTAYGRAIFVKVALLVAAIWVAVIQREYLLPRLRRLADGEEPAPARGATDAPAAADASAATDATAATDPVADGMVRAAPSAATGRHVRLALRAEVLLLVAVLAATGALAGYPPPKSLDAGPVTVTRQAGSAELQLTVDPARVGQNVMHLYAFGRDGQALRAATDLKVRAVPPGRSGGSDVPVDVPFVVSGPGHWTAAAVPLGTRGEWTMQVTFRTSPFDLVEAKLPVRVR
ncbi:copper resistance CopC/CopD family protein [Patulibacter sp.]|uniref:copper resistance CopC/CopD family protein n=1 Tax=Patulibacter sp. TaxID=1912859 RepID=UPI00271EA7D0|nr:copper resistance protein CopC [Patulibacter sp.]MDO9406916.1 copper resistance protein CopC [Patulibacter sp.]